MISCSTLHMKAESSTTSTRIFLSAVFIISILPYRHARGGPSLFTVASDEAFDRRDQLVFLHGFGEEAGCAFLHGAITMLGSGARRDYKHGNFSGRGILPEMRHQLIAVHPRHFEVGDYQVAADLRDHFGGFEAVGSQLDAIASLFEHAAYEFADADRIVGDNDHTMVLNRVDRLRRNAACGDGRCSGSKNARGRR